MTKSRFAELAPFGRLAVMAALAGGCDSPAATEERECAPPTVQAPLERAEVADGELFEIVRDPVLDTAQARQLEVLRGWDGVLGVSVARVTGSARTLLRAGSVLGIRFSDSARTIVRVDRAIDHCSSSEPGCDPPQRFASGLVLAENPAAHFSVLLAASGLVGNLSRGGFQYWFQPIGGGLQAIAERSWCLMDIRED